MKKIRCLISAGPTREHLDPVRFVSNPSTGKMGIAIAEACRDAGWEVELVLGPTHLKNPDGVETSNVVSADEMYEALSARFGACDILIMSAAVSDMKPKVCESSKVKKSRMNFNVEFEPTRDILKTLSARKASQILVGFAAETDNVEDYARRKLEEKNLDCIAANTVCKGEGGFASDDNALTLIMRGGEKIHIPMASKSAVAKSLVEILKKRFSPQAR